jgi:hypothetical protein
MEPQNLSSSGDPQQTGITPPRSLFAEDVPRTPLPPPDSQAPPPLVARPVNLVTKVVLPLVVLIVGIAAIAWVTQQLPGRGAKTGTPEGAKNEARDVLAFTHNEWSDKTRGYLALYEINTDGFHDFPFENQTGKDLDMGVAETTCQCAKVEVCVFKDHQRANYEKAVNEGNEKEVQLGWEKMAADREMKQSILVPTNGAGVVRVFWRGKSEPANQGFRVTLWSRAAGSGRDRGKMVLDVGIAYALPALFDMDRLDFGVLGPQQKMTRSFLCFSYSRELEVKADSKDKCLVVEVVPLKGKEYDKQAFPLVGGSVVALLGGQGEQGPFFAAACALAGADRLPDELRPYKRVPAAFRVNVTLYEQRDGKQLDLGHYKEDVPLIITSHGRPLEPANLIRVPTMRAIVRGDVTVQGPPEEGGRINFGLFKFTDGAKRKVFIFAPKGANLKFMRCEPSLLDLEVQLKALDAVGDQGRWEMDVTIPAGRDASPLPEDGVIVLQCMLPARGDSPAVTRMARIPVVGTATQH